MKELFLILFFSKLIVLTPTPIQLTNDWFEIIPPSPLKAITGGAGIYIDVTAVVSKHADDEDLERMFPPNSIIVKLIDKKGNEFLMANRHSYSTSEEGIEIILFNDSPTPTDKKFTKVLIKSEKTITAAKVIWRNCKL